MKKLLVVLISLALCSACFAGCSSPASEESTPSEADTSVSAETSSTESESSEASESEASTPADPIAALPGSIYYYGYEVEGLGNMVQFYHFYPDDLGIGAVFYAGYAWNQISFSGTYTVTEEPCEYEALPEKGDDVEAVTGTAPYTITLYDWDGTELDKIAYDGEHVYNIAVNTNCDPMTGGGNFILSKADDTALETYADTFDGEKGVAYLNFISPDDASATLQLNTNGTYNDMAIFAVDGTWEKTAEGEYTLTPENDSDEGAVVTLQEDGSYLYVSDSGTEVVMEQVVEAAVAYTFTGKIPFMDSEADVTILAMDDGSCVVNMSAFGTATPIDQGTWSEEEFVFTFTFDVAGEIVSEFGGETGVQVTYSCDSVEAVGGTAVEAICGVVLKE